MKTKKLSLNRETLRHLGNRDLVAVGGARSIVCSQIGPQCTTGDTGGGGSGSPVCGPFPSIDYCPTGLPCKGAFTDAC